MTHFVNSDGTLRLYQVASPPPHEGSPAMSTTATHPHMSSLAAQVRTWQFGDTMFSPPVTTNHWAIVQCNRSPVGLVSLTALPFMAGHQPDHPWYFCNMTTGEAMLDGKLLNASLGTKECRSQWFGDRAERWAEDERLLIHNTTFCPWDAPAVVQRITLTNKDAEPRSVTFGISLRGCPGKLPENTFGRTFTTWNAAVSPGPEDGALSYATEECCIVEGLVDAPAFVHGRIAQHQVSLQPGESKTLHYLAVLGDCAEQTAAIYQQLAEETRDDSLLARHMAETPQRVADALGGMPVLHTSDPDLQALYDAGLRAVWGSRCITPDAAVPQTYRAIGPQVCVNGVFLWDWAVGPHTSMGADPDLALANLKAFLATPPAQSSAKCLYHGNDVGEWYPANHWALIRMAAAYTRRHGHDWLLEDHDTSNYVDRLRAHAIHWRKHLTEQGLAYHPGSALLEVVSDYRGTVVGINANHAHAMLLFAEILETIGTADYLNEAASFRQDAQHLINAIAEHLWDAEEETFICIQPEGEHRRLFHAYDAACCLTLINDHLPADMIAAIRKRIHHHHSELWLHACDPGDHEATWSPRADHNALGSYAGWPAMIALHYVQNTCSEAEENWLRGIAKTCAADPLGQAHMVDSMFPTPEGAALKAPPEHPYDNEWLALCGCAFGDLITQGVFAGGTHPVNPLFDPDARLEWPEQST